MADSQPEALVVGFQPEPKDRGTIGILLPCLAVLVLNVWTLFHVNIPPAGQSAHLFWLHRVKIWIITLIVPDGIATEAFAQRRAARRSVVDMRKEDTYGWWTLQHAFYAEMGGYRVRDSSGQEYAFRSAELYELVRRGLITLPEVTTEDLDDRSDADGFVKGLALLQSVYFLVVVFARFQQNLHVTTLEVETIPFIFTTWWTYFCWWEKPVNIQRRTLVPCGRLNHEVLLDVAKTVSPSESSYWWRPVTRELHQLGWDFYWFEGRFDFSKWKTQEAQIPPRILKKVRGKPMHARTKDWYLPSIKELHPSQWGWEEDAMIYGLGIFFNGLLLIAWNSTFPSQIESILWKCSVFVMIGTITLWWPIAWLASYTFKDTSLAKHTFYYVIIGLYMLGRAYVFVEPFVGLRALPASAYQTISWSKYIPHFQ